MDQLAAMEHAMLMEFMRYLGTKMETCLMTTMATLLTTMGTMTLHGTMMECMMTPATRMELRMRTMNQLTTMNQPPTMQQPSE